MSSATGPNLGRPVHFSTDDLPERDRVAIWCETYGRTLFNVEIDPIGDGPFRADVTMRTLADVRISTGSRSEAHYRLRPDLLHKAADMVGIVMMSTGRAHTSQFGREAMIEAGDGIPVLTTEPLAQTVLDNGHHLGVYVPRSIIAPMVRDLDSVLMNPISGNALCLLSDYVAAVQRLGTQLAPALQRSVAEHFCDLVALAFGAKNDVAQIAQMRGARAARAKQVIMEIEANFINQGFSAHSVARKLGVSPRYVQDLLHETGLSFTERVMESRLQRARQMLLVRNGGHLKISDIAYSCGFANVSYFNQAFRRRFGASPTQYRGGSGN
jgi:AraC-like DNA-binding protein